MLQISKMIPINVLGDGNRFSNLRPGPVNSANQAETGPVHLLKIEIYY